MRNTFETFFHLKSFRSCNNWLFSSGSDFGCQLNTTSTNYSKQPLYRRIYNFASIVNVNCGLLTCSYVSTSSLRVFLIEFWLKATLSYRMSARFPFAGLVTIAFFNYVFLSLVFNEILYGRN